MKVVVSMLVHVPISGKWPICVSGKVELEIAGTEMIGTYINNEIQESTSIRFECLPKCKTKLRGKDSLTH